MSDWVCTNELRRIRCRHLNAPSEKLQQKWTRGKPVRYEYPEPDSTHEVLGCGIVRVFKSGPIPAIGDNVTVAGEHFTVTGVERIGSSSPFGLLLRESESDYAEEWRDIPVAED